MSKHPTLHLLNVLKTRVKVRTVLHRPRDQDWNEIGILLKLPGDDRKVGFGKSARTAEGAADAPEGFFAGEPARKPVNLAGENLKPEKITAAFDLINNAKHVTVINTIYIFLIVTFGIT
jgi:hypothetical protein